MEHNSFSSTVAPSPDSVVEALHSPMYVEWNGQRVFEGHAESGNNFAMDAYESAGGQNRGPAPLEAFLLSGAACSAIDVLSILEKKHQVVTSYRVEVDSSQLESKHYPKPYTDLVFRHVISGKNLDAVAVEQAVKLSDEKYCTVIATLRSTPTVTSTFLIFEAS